MCVYVCACVCVHARVRMRVCVCILWEGGKKRIVDCGWYNVQNFLVNAFMINSKGNGF